MWTATTAGFFSAVQHRDDPSLLVVRTRDHSDATRLRDWYTHWLSDLAAITEDATQGLPQPVIVSYAVSDYPWRVIMPRTAWGAFLAEAVEDLDYGNFKDAVKAVQGGGRAHVYSNVWAALLRLEDLDPLGRRPYLAEDSEPWSMYDAWEGRFTDAPGMYDEPDEGLDFWATNPSPAEVTAYLEAHE